jgi:hypothetical protein
MPHCRDAHVATPLAGLGHALPHAPQLVSSLATSTHDRSHRVSPAAHEDVHPVGPQN